MDPDRIVCCEQGEPRSVQWCFLAAMLGHNKNPPELWQGPWETRHFLQPGPQGPQGPEEIASTSSESCGVADPRGHSGCVHRYNAVLNSLYYGGLEEAHDGVWSRVGRQRHPRHEALLGL